MRFWRRSSLTTTSAQVGTGDVSADGDVTARDIVTGTQIFQIFQIYSSAGGAAGREEFDSAVIQYLRWLESDINRVFLRGLKRGQGAAVEVPLDRVFIPLNAEVSSDVGFTGDRSAPDGLNREIGYGAVRPFTEIRTASLPTIYPFGPRVAIIGKPGSGKTTLLHQIALNLSRALLYEKRELAEHILGPAAEIPLPVIVPLALYGEHRLRFAKSSNPRDRQLATFVSHYLLERQAGLDLPADFFSVLLRQGAHVMMLLDGLDEVRTPELRAVVVQAVRDLLSARRHLECVITSRPHSYDDEVAIGAGFRTLRLLPLTLTQTGDLIDRMTNETPGLSDVSARVQAADFLRDKMAAIDRIPARPAGDPDPIFGTPLMVRLAFVAQHNGQPFSINRAQLFASTVDALLTGNYNPDELVNAFLTQGTMTWLRYRELLQYVAFELHSRTSDRSPALDRATLGSLVRLYLSKNLHMSGKVVEQLVEAFLATATERGAILTASGGVFSVREHRLQEFLAARYMAERIRDVDQIAEFMENPSRATSYWWREVFMLTIGYLGITTPDTQLMLLMRLAGLTQDQPLLSAAALATTELAATAMIEYGYEDPNHLALVKNRLAELLFDVDLAVQSGMADYGLRVRAGDTLGYLGDPRPGVDPSQTPPARYNVGVFCEVPAGTFVMGSDKQVDDQAFPQEPDAAISEISNPYLISRYPVTGAQFRFFEQNADGYANDANWTDTGLQWRERHGEHACDSRAGKGLNHPITDITWYECQAYCAWLRSIILADGGVMVWSDGLVAARQLRPLAVRLPTEAEWEKAARGPHGRRYSWGSSVDDAIGVHRRTTLGRSTTVGIFADEDSPYGAIDMCGNVWEWCQDAWRSRRVEPAASQVVAFPDEQRAVRGGGFGPDKRMLRAACRFGNLAAQCHDDLGFRVVIIPTGSSK
jgi:formylglycine-generating enzyme required for sulfatase activity